MKFSPDFDFKSFYTERDFHYWEKIKTLAQDNNLELKEILQNYMAFIQRRDLPQLLAYYELFKEVQSLPGSIVEVGVFFGNGLFTWSKLLETFCPGNRGRKVYGFDNFSGYDEEVSEIDKRGIEHIGEMVGDFKVSKELVNELVKLNNLDNLIPGVKRIELYDGNLRKSLKDFKEEETGVRICLLVVDVNLFTPTKIALEELYDKMVRGGVILLRGYGVKPWEGESKAVDEFLEKKGIKEVKTFPFSMYPAIYFKKI